MAPASTEKLHRSYRLYFHAPPMVVHVYISICVCVCVCVPALSLRSLISTWCCDNSHLTLIVVKQAKQGRDWGSREGKA